MEYGIRRWSSIFKGDMGMGQVRNKDIILLLRQTLKSVDRLLMDHGSRTAYILYKMLQEEGKLEIYELADYAVFATFHDIGAYRTEELEDMLNFETKSFMPHSIYGYLFFKKWSPFTAEDKILLYHHANCEQYDKINYAFKNIASYLFLADRMDIYYITQGSTFDIYSLRKYEGTRYTKEALDLLEKAARKTNILEKLANETYQTELDQLLDYLVISNEDEEKYIHMIVNSMGFRDQRYTVDTAVCMCICEEIATKMYLTEKQKEILKYAALIHDIGMLLLPQEMINAPRKLTSDEMMTLETHVEMLEPIFRKILPGDIVDVAITHHENGAGSGYPKRIKAMDMNTLQRILQVADMVTSLSSKRTYRDAKDSKEIETILQEGVKANRLSPEVVSVLLQNYDIIMAKAKKEKEQLIGTYAALEKEYEQSSGTYL